MSTSHGCTVRIMQSGEEYWCRSSETLLLAMVRLGRKGIPVGCVSGGCGVCKVLIRSGNWHKSGPMSRAHVSADEEAQGIGLACRIVPDGDIELDVIGKMQRAVLAK